MEFPDLGKHCSERTCQQLDFLPMQCDACQKIFCTKHFSYAQHSCPESYKKDKQVPVCPLCNTPISIPNGESVDAVVGRHIDSDCQSETAQSRRKVYSNRCALKGCKQKEVMQVLCEKCRNNFCLRHRNELDHSCKGFEESGRGVSSAGAAAVARASSSSSSASSNSTKPQSSIAPSSQLRTPQKTALSSIGAELNREREQRNAVSRPTAIAVHALQQPELSEEEAVRRAIELSLHAGSLTTTISATDRRAQEEADAALARALQESEREASRTGSNYNRSSSNNSSSSNRTTCSMS